MSKKKLPKHFYILNPGTYPVTAVFAPNERAYRRALKRYSINKDLDDGTYPSSAGRVTRYSSDERSNGNNAVLIVTIDLSLDVSEQQLAALVAHECVHVMQYIFSEIGEDRPGWEVEAYAVQSLVQDILCSIKHYRKELAS